MKTLTKANTFLQKYLLPPQFFHWKTPLLISLFFFLISALEIKNQGLKHSLGDFSWLFFTIGVGWRTNQPPFLIRGISISPWIIGGLISIFLSGKLAFDRQALAVIFWPIISVCLAVIIKFINSGAKLEPTPPLIRPIFLIIILIHVLISCWLAFHFIIQGWLNEYPSVLANDFSKSSFVISLKPPSLTNSRGMLIIKLMEQQLNIKTRNQSWEKVEAWLIAMSRNQYLMRNEIFHKIPSLRENSKWELKTEIIQGQSRYQLRLLAVWHGLSNKPGGYTLSKFCEVTKMVNRATVVCQPIKMDNSSGKIRKIKGENQI
ncbi:hypothetical protein BCD67_16255 [Oscillatoriales cyanobacterium USR001]|nr:hypothetical protein BCD67_16255 [Oscillatoriales cyanobacterium USR001]